MSFCFLNGKVINENRAVVRLEKMAFDSYAVVENVPVRKGKASFLTEHGQRLRASMRAMSINKLPWNFENACREVVQKNRVSHGNLQVRAWADSGNGNVVAMLIRPHVRKGPFEKPTDIRLITVPGSHYGSESMLGRLKSAAMLNNLSAARESAAWAEDGLRLTPGGMVAEGVWTNIIIEKNNIVKTPPLSEGILEGVTRTVFLKSARKRGQVVKEVRLTRYDLYTADKVWVCSSLNGSVPVSSVDGRKIG